MKRLTLKSMNDSKALPKALLDRATAVARLIGSILCVILFFPLMIAAWYVVGAGLLSILLGIPTLLLLCVSWFLFGFEAVGSWFASPWGQRIIIASNLVCIPVGFVFCSKR